MGVENTNNILNQDLELFEKKIKLIGLSDPEKYKEFLDRLKDIQNFALGMTKNEFNDAKYSIIDDFTKLQFDFDNYMTGSQTNSTIYKTESGKTKCKKYHINLYISIVNDLKKLNQIDIEKIRMLRQKWNSEKTDEYLEYLPIEISIVEEAISSAFLEYQIKYAIQNKQLPEDKIQDYTSFEEYTSRIKEKLIDISQNTSISPEIKLEISELLSISELSELLKSDKLWKILTSQNISIDNRKINIMQGNDVQESNKKENNLPAVINDSRKKNLYAIGTIRKKGIFGKEKEKKVKIKIRRHCFGLYFRYQDSLISITIPEGVLSIDENGFRNYSKLERVQLPSTLSTIYSEAFKNCTSLEEINLPDSLKIINQETFCNCENLRSINFPPNISVIGIGAFQNTGIKEINLEHINFEIYSTFSGRQWQALQSQAFMDCTSLEKVILPQNLKHISENLFKNCTALKDITFPNNLKYINSSAFYNCQSLTEVTNLPDTVEQIASQVFDKCSNLKRFRIPTFLKKITSSFDYTQIFDEFILPKQLMNCELFENLNLNEKNLLTIPEDAQGYLYEKLGFIAGQKVTLDELKLAVANKEATETMIEPETKIVYKMDYAIKRTRAHTKVIVPPEIIDIEKKDNSDDVER